MYRPLGTGDVDVESIVSTLQGNGYAGWYTLEQDTILTEEPRGEGPVTDVRTSADYVRSLLTLASEVTGPWNRCASECWGRRASASCPSSAPLRPPGRAWSLSPRVTEAGPRRFAEVPRHRAGPRLVRRRDRRPRGRGDLQPARQQPARTLEQGGAPRREARPDREAVRQQRRRGRPGAGPRAGPVAGALRGVPLPLPPADAAPDVAARRRRAGRAATRREHHVHVRARRGRPAMVTRPGRRIPDGPRLLRPARPARPRGLRRRRTHASSTPRAPNEPAPPASTTGPTRTSSSPPAPPVSRGAA